MLSRLSAPAAVAVLSAILIGFGRDAVGSQEEPVKSRLHVLLDGESETRVHCLDLLASERSPSFRQTFSLRKSSDLPLAPSLYAVVWEGAGGSAAATLVDLRKEPVAEVRKPRIAGRGGALIVRLGRSRSLRGDDSLKVKLVAGEEQLSPASSLEEIFVFGPVPKRAPLTLRPPTGVCLLKPFQALLKSDEAWRLVEAEVGRCSRVTVSLERSDESLVYPLPVRLKGMTTSGDPGDVIRADAIKKAAPLTLDGISPGDYAIEVEIPQFQFLYRASLHLDPEAETAVAVPLPVITVSGVARFGNSPAHGTVEFTSSGSGRRAVCRASLSDDSRYSVVLAGPGTHLVRLQDPSLAGENGPWYHVKVSDQPQIELDLNFNETRILGRVVDTEGQPVPDAKVSIEATGADSGISAVYVSGPDGSFVVYPPAGSVSLAVSKGGYRPQTPMTRLVVEEGAELTPVLVLRKVHSVRVTIQTPSGSPARGHSVYCTNIGSLTNWREVGVTGEDGAVDVDIEGGLPSSCNYPTPEGALGAFLLSSEAPFATTIQPVGATVNMMFVDDQERPLSGKKVILRNGGLVICPDALADHLALRREGDISKLNGTLRLLSIPTGWTELYLARSDASLFSAVQGLETDRLAGFELGTGDVRTITVHLGREAPGK